MIKAIIFDMDGVLFDTEKFYYHRRETFLMSQGISIAHMSPRDFVGGRLDQVWEKILGNSRATLDVEALEDDYRTYKLHHRAPYQELVFPDTLAVLSSLCQSGITLALASNSELKDISYALSSIGAQSYFSCILSGSDFAEGKPDPAIYKEAIKRLGFPEAETIVVEDSQKGIAAGKAAGVSVAAIQDRYFGSDQSQADLLVKDLTELLDVIQMKNHHHHK